MRALRKLAAIIFLGLCALPAFAEETPKAKAKFEDTVFDFGVVSQGNKVTHEFVVKNEGTADLVIQRLIPACGCTAAAASPDPIKPGERGNVKVEFDTSGFSGEKLKTVRVYTNDMEDPSTMLTIRGIVEPEVSIEPVNLIFEEVVRGGAPQSKTVTVRVREGSKVDITSIKAFSRFLQIQEKESGPKRRVVAVTIDPSAPLGELRERVVVSVSGGRESSINIPILAVVKGRLVFRPAQVSFGVLEGGQEIVRSVKFDNLGANPVSIKDVKSSNPAVSASIKEVEAGKKFILQVKVDPRKVSRELRAAVEVITDNTDEPTLSLSVYGILPPKQ